MFGSGMLDTAIGLVMFFGLVSLICTAAKEWLEGLLRARAATLEAGLREMLSDPDGTGYALKLYNHPLIFSLFKGAYDAAPAERGLLTRLTTPTKLPSYIPTGTFVAALVDTIMRDARAAAPPAAMPAAMPAPAPAAPADAPAVAAPPVPAADPAAPPAQLTFAALRAAAAQITNDHVRQAVLAALDSANNDLETARANLGAWFDSTMDRVSGWYRRNTQYMLFFLGLTIAALMNADAIGVMRNLEQDAALRAGIVAQMQSVATLAGDPKAPVRIVDLETQVEKLGVPIGWNFPPYQMAGCEAGPAGQTVTRCRSGAGLQMLLGWLATALATMLGAPFWFDTLNKIMVVRSTVKPDEKSPPEGSKDPQ